MTFNRKEALIQAFLLSFVQPEDERYEMAYALVKYLARGMPTEEVEQCQDMARNRLIKTD